MQLEISRIRNKKLILKITFWEQCEIYLGFGGINNLLEIMPPSTPKRIITIMIGIKGLYKLISSVLATRGGFLSLKLLKIANKWLKRHVLDK